jgi:hypothetical protein
MVRLCFAARFAQRALTKSLYCCSRFSNLEPTFGSSQSCGLPSSVTGWRVCRTNSPPRRRLASASGVFAVRTEPKHSVSSISLSCLLFLLSFSVVVRHHVVSDDTPLDATMADIVSQWTAKLGSEMTRVLGYVSGSLSYSLCTACVVPVCIQRIAQSLSSAASRTCARARPTVAISSLTSFVSA